MEGKMWATQDGVLRRNSLYPLSPAWFEDVHHAFDLVECGQLGSIPASKYVRIHKVPKEYMDYDDCNDSPF